MLGDACEGIELEDAIEKLSIRKLITGENCRGASEQQREGKLQRFHKWGKGGLVNSSVDHPFRGSLDWVSAFESVVR